MPDTILYVDDDAANARVFAATLRGKFHVLTAPGGAEALDLLKGQEIAVLIADQRMPRMTGVELLEITARDHAETVRILVTAYSDLDAAIGAINRGQVSRYIRKPWTPEELEAVVGEALELYRVRSQLRVLEARLRETERVYAVGVVAASIAHDLRNPLMVVQGAIDMLRRSLPREPVAVAQGDAAAEPAPPDSARMLLFLRDAQTAVERMTEIIAGMNASQRSVSATTTDDLAQVVRLSIACLHGTLRRRGALSVKLQIVPPVKGSPTALSQVLLNLLVNALEALPEGGDPRSAVTVRLLHDGDAAVVEVEDTGPGIAPQVLERVFDPFFTTKEDGGTGLGLAISKRIVDEIGGSIRVTSQPGAGSRFTVRLPLAPSVPLPDPDPRVRE
jgi:two-component system sensor histidine kinase/response regulator